MLHHIAIPDPAEEGLWLVAYIVPGTATASAVACGMPERAARTEARRLNLAGAARDAENLIELERRIAPGLYADGEAQ